MKKRCVYSIGVLLLLLTSCSLNGEKFVLTEFIENNKTKQDFLNLHKGYSYNWSADNGKLIANNDKVTIEYEKMRLKEILHKLGYASHSKYMSKNPIISIYYKKKNTTAERAKSEIMDALFNKYSLE